MSSSLARISTDMLCLNSMVISGMNLDVAKMFAPYLGAWRAKISFRNRERDPPAALAFVKRVDDNEDPRTHRHYGLENSRDFVE